MMMGDGGDLRLRDGFRQRQSKRHMHGNCKRVFGDQQVDIEFMNKFMKAVLQ